MESNRQKLSRERKPKARSIIRAAHAILQTYDPATVVKLCREIIGNANSLLNFTTLLQNNPEQCADENQFPLREGMEGL